MAKLPASSLRTVRPIGCIDPAGAGHGAHWTVFRSPDAPGILLPQYDRGPNPTDFLTVDPARVIEVDFGLGDLDATDPAAFPMVYIAPNGTLLHGVEHDLDAQIERSLRADPVMWQAAPLSHLELVRRLGARDLLPDALTRAHACMCPRPENAGSFWATHELSEAVKPSVAAVMPDASPDEVRDAYWVRTQGPAAWLVVTPALRGRINASPTPFDLSLYETTIAAFGYAHHGLVDAGTDSPSRWRPAAA